MAENSTVEENIEVPPIHKETAGAVAGAALGSMMGPAGAVVGGIVGAIAGKAAGEGRFKPPIKRTAARVFKPAPKHVRKTVRGKTTKRKPVRRASRSRKRIVSKRGKTRRRRR